MSAPDSAPTLLSPFGGEPKALSNRYTWLRCATLYLFCVFAIAAALVVHRVHSEVNLTLLFDWYWLGLPLLVFLTLGTIVSSRVKFYAVDEHYLSFSSGLIFKHTTVQPFTRLQHIEITRGPLERVFGLATLKLFSAGGAQHAVAVPGLAAAEAEQMRSAILDSKGLAYEQ